MSDEPIMHAYHYCALRVFPGGQLAYRHGVAKVDIAVDSGEAYRLVVEHVAKGLGLTIDGGRVEPWPVSETVILSFTPLYGATELTAQLSDTEGEA